MDGAPPQLPDSPEAVAAVVSKREAAVEGLRPDCEARVTWGSTPGQKTPMSFVYLHGFSASRRETAPLSENLARHYGANLFEARLTGHGRTGEGLGQATAEEWVRDTREAIAVGRALGDRTVIIGCSTGATLAMLVAVEDQPDVAAYVLVSPNFGPRSAASGLLLWPWAEKWVPLITGETRSWEPENEAQGKYWTTSYPVSALFPMMAVVERARTAALDKVGKPVLMLHTADDPVVDVASIESAFIRMSSAKPKDRQVVDGTGNDHVLAGDVLSPGRTAQVEERVKAFLQTAQVVQP